MSREKLIVIGNGMAGIKCVEEIIKLAPEKFQITVFGNEPHPNYNRILLSKVLQGDSSIESIVINDWSWYEERGIRLYTGETVNHIHTDSKYITTISGIRAEYNSLIIATGSSAFIPPIAGVHKSGVISFRSIKDCKTMMDYAKKYKKAAVIGGGLLGLEAARGLLHLGMETDVIHNAPYLMNRQLDRISSDMLRKELEEQGMRFWLSKETESITGLNRAKGIRFTNGSTLEADLIVISVGIRPNVELAKQSGIATNRAIMVDDFMRTSKPHIYAVGECAEHRGVAYGLVAPLYEQGKVLAKSICGNPSEPYLGSVPYAQLKVSGVEVFSVGEIRQEEAETAIQLYDGIRGTYKKVTMKGGAVSGVILFGDTAEGMSLLDLVKREAPVTELNRPSAEGGSSGPGALAEMMPDRETVCVCNAVQKSAIMRAVTEDGLQTTDQVRDRTKASSSCGGCRPMVAAIVQYALRYGKGEAAVTAFPICGCTAVSHERLKETIEGKPLTATHELMAALDWKSLSGCSICSAAIHYYSALYHPQAADLTSNTTDECRFSLIAEPLSPGTKSKAPTEFDSIYVRTKLQQSCGGLLFPAPVKAAITSSSIHNPAGVLVQDIGITGAPAGWEIYGGGHAEHPVKQGQLIAIAESDAVALSLSVAYLQLYRERAEYGEAVWKWLEREGIIEVREQLLDTTYRMALAGRARAAAIGKQSKEGLGVGICSSH
ncbi:nitrite reductase large subunit NirB [Bacillus sp. FJAT-26390]|uniref:nitrite reductase large subunit NirB n=1 Tax=Bacillus sp. FJAT-26390 TaxID=1743142 RepID=UPI000807F521|nr:nitrite reductase large subunit NirB [Bacillus sp. FJAT-26390]OBZ17278.1 nitrite reductase [Bacillus sp. FJAT-26390]